MKLQDLNPPQQQAITCVDQPCLVLAGAGSGKTRVITHKIAYLIHQAGYDPSTIRALTFTNKAAREMKQRATALLGKKHAKGLGISTFHTLGLPFCKVNIIHLDTARALALWIRAMLNPV